MPCYAEQLGNRLCSEGGRAYKEQAMVCYVCAASAERVVSLWYVHTHTPGKVD